MQNYKTETIAEKAQLQYVMSRADLEAALESIVEKYISRREAMKVPKMLTAAETSEMCHVSRMTLHRWEKTGYLVPIHNGKMLRYRENDVRRIMEGR